MTGLERRYRRLLRAYPAWYRRERSEEMLGTLLEDGPPGRRWPPFRNVRALVIGGLRVRGLTWSLSMLWVAAGAVYASYLFYTTTKPWPGIDLGLVGWAEVPVTVKIVIALAIFVLCAGLIPAPIAGLIRLRGWRRGNWLRAAAWAGAWIAGVALMFLASVWGQYPVDSCPNSPGAVPSQCPYGSPAVVSWGELPICGAWLLLGILMTWILSVPQAGQSAPAEARRSSPAAVPARSG
jgi:hypothetical protein